MFCRPVFIFIFIFPCFVFASDAKDSLKALYQESESKASAFDFGMKYISALDLNSENAEVHRVVSHLRTLPEIETGNRMVRLMSQVGYYHLRCFDHDSALWYFKKCREQLNGGSDLMLKLEIDRGTGVAYNKKGDHTNAVKSLINGLEGAEKYLVGKHDSAVATQSLLIQLELGWSLVLQKDYNRALSYFQKSLELAQDYSFTTKLTRIYTNLGSVYYYQNNFEEAIRQFQEGLKVAQQLNDIDEIGNCYNNIGLIYQEEGKYNEALEYLKKAYEIAEIRREPGGISEVLFNLGEIYRSMKDDKKAEEYYLKSSELAKQIDYKLQMKDAYKALSSLYAKIGKYALAYQYSQMADTLKDSLFTEERTRQITEMNTKYQTERKEQENNILKEQTRNQELVNSRQRLVLIGVAGLALILVAFAFYIHRSYREKQRANVILADKNAQIEEKSRIVEEQNKDIKDSIRYAKRLQEAILPPIPKFREAFPESFILFKPKDIVSGDFYWFERFGEKVFFAAADCTGHGVPGAFMSIMGSNLLNQSLNEYAITKTNALLNSVNKGLAKALRTQDEGNIQVRDGMDIALCSVDLKTLKLEYSGAFNPVWIIRKGEVVELKPDKFPVGASASAGEVQFSMKDFQLEKGDRVYVFTDGYADQFGGPKGKKFKYAPLQKALIDMEGIAMEQQRVKLNQIHEDWRGHLEQVDDILLIGVRI